MEYADDMLTSPKKSGKARLFRYAGFRLASDDQVSRAKVRRDFKMVPVKGGAAGIQQVLGGHVDTTWSGSGWTEQVRAGKMKPLATMSAEAHGGLPEDPDPE